MRRLFPLFLALGLSWSPFAQQATAPPSSGDPIPDYVAFRLFFAAVAENSSASPAESARQDSRLNPIKLADVDKAVLVRALSGYKTNLASAQRAPTTTLNAVVQTTLNTVVQTTLTELTTQMSPDGFQRLYTYVRFQKQYMGVAPLPASTTAHH